MKKQAFVFGNWKMNQLQADIEAFVSEIKDANFHEKLSIGIAPQAMHLPKLSQEFKSKSIQVGSQTISQYDQGAYTGELSPLSLKEIGVQFCLVGHSERRALFKETHLDIEQKVLKALEHNFSVILCVGETLAERQKGSVFDVLTDQLTSALQKVSKDQVQNLMVAYEPVWAIGTGEVATPHQADEAHFFIKELLERTFEQDSCTVPILYGGSVKPSNFKELLEMKHIDGALVGGASLKASSFMELCQIASSVID